MNRVPLTFGGWTYDRNLALQNGEVEIEGLPASVVKAFTQSKNECLRNIYGTGGALKASVPWLVEAVEEARALMGPDHWPYGIDPNRKALEAVARWSHAQGLTSKVFTPEELFPVSTHGEYKI